MKFGDAAGADYSIINSTALMPQSWRFLAPQMAFDNIAWHTATAQDFGGATRLGRLRAAYKAVQTAYGAARAGQKTLLVSHLPTMAALTNGLRRCFAPRVPQIAFAFNYTRLPTGLNRAAQAALLRSVDQFVVFSTYEKALYAESLNIPEERIHFMKWAMEAPDLAAQPPADAPRGPYLCSIGGEARDYHLVAETMRKMPSRQAVVVARPYSVEGIDFPDNVTVYLNLPADQTWRLAYGSQGLLLPLDATDAACGHITFCAAQLLAIPIIASATSGLADYADAGGVYRAIEVGSVDAAVAAVDALYDAPEEARARAETFSAKARKAYDISHWVQYLAGRLKAL